MKRNHLALYELCLFYFFASPWTVGRFALIKPETLVVEVVPADTGEATAVAAAAATATGGDAVAEEEEGVDSRMVRIIIHCGNTLMA